MSGGESRPRKAVRFMAEFEMLTELLKAATEAMVLIALIIELVHKNRRS
jgi:predicted RNase H-like nuclease